MKKLAFPEKVKDPYLEGIPINDFDNINLCGTNFQFSKIDSVFIPDYNEQSVLFDKMIDSIGNVHDVPFITNFLFLPFNYFHKNLIKLFAFVFLP
jgi:hypothetical protein